MFPEYWCVCASVQGTIIVKQLDLSDLASIRRFTADFLATEEGPDLLILNAGVMACPLGYTKDGFEMQIGACCDTSLDKGSVVKKILLEGTSRTVRQSHWG